MIKWVTWLMLLKIVAQDTNYSIYTKTKGLQLHPHSLLKIKTGLIFFKFTNYWIILLQNETEFCIFTSLKRRHTSKCKAPMYVYVYYVIVLPSKSKIVS